MTQYGYRYTVEPKPYTITDLSLAWGFNSRQTLILSVNDGVIKVELTD